MTQARLARVTGALFIVAAISFSVAATVLSATFNWPDILRERPAVVLTEFQAGGSSLIWTWFAVAWTYFLLLFPILLLKRVLAHEEIPYLETATIIGAVSVVASLLGFLRWVFVMPDLAALFADPGANGTTGEAVISAYVAQHQYGGALLGEHVGGTLAIIWSTLISVAMLRSRRFPRWLGWFGLAAGAIYLLNQGDSLATAVPDFPVWEPAGLVGSTLWALWIVALGIALMRGAGRREARDKPLMTPAPLEVSVR